MGIDISGRIDILGVDILGIDILASTLCKRHFWPHEKNIFASALRKHTHAIHSDFFSCKNGKFN